MNEEEVKAALRCCIVRDPDDKLRCAECPYRDPDIYCLNRLKMDALKQDQDVSIRLQNRLPEWIATSSTDDDTNLSAADFAGTTFGLKYLLQGIYDSYKKLSDGEPYYFELKLKLKR